MPISPLKLANTFLARYALPSGGIDHMKLQKLAYFTHGWWLAYHPESLLTERPQVWKYGPVFPSLYKTLSIFGTKPINGPVSNNPFADSEQIPIDAHSEQSEIVDWVWQRYGHLSALQLSDLTHKPGSAWRVVAEERKFVVPNNFPLDDDKVRQEFDALKAQI